MLSESISVLFQYAKLKHLVHLPIGLLNGHPSNITTVTNKYILFLVKKNCIFFLFRMTVTAPMAQISVLKRKCFLLLVKIDQSDRTAFMENGTAGKMDTVKMDKNY